MLSADKFWITVATATSNTFILEAYNSDVRAYGVSFCFIFGKLGGMSFP